MHSYAIQRHCGLLLLLLLCLLTVALAADAPLDYFLRSQSVIFDARSYPTNDSFTRLARTATLSFADALYASVRRPGTWSHYAFSKGLVVPALFVTAVVMKHWVAFKAENKERRFLAAATKAPEESSLPDLLEPFRNSGAVAAPSTLVSMLSPVVVFFACVALNHVLIQAMLFYPAPHLDDAGHFKKMQGLSASIETLLSALLANTVAKALYEQRAKDSLSSSLLCLLLFFTVRRFLRDWFARIVGSGLFLTTFVSVYLLAHFPAHMTGLQWLRGRRSLCWSLLVGGSLAGLAYLQKAFQAEGLQALGRHVSGSALAWQLATKAVRQVWLFFLEDVHFFAGFSMSTWNNAFDKFQKASLSIPTIMTSADTTFVLFIYGSQQMKYFYQYQGDFDASLKGNTASIVLCQDNETMAVPRQCMNADFYKQSYAALPASDTVPRQLFSKALGLQSENLTWTNCIDVWVADYLYYAIRTNKHLFPVFSSRLIVPFVTLGLAAGLYCRSFYAAQSSAPTLNSLLALSGCNNHPGSLEAYFKAYLKSKENELLQMQDGTAAAIKSRHLPAHILKSKKLGSAKAATWLSKYGAPLKLFVLPFLISFGYFFFQHLLIQAHMFYQYDQTLEVAARFMMGAIYSVDYIFTYTIATPIADSFWYYRPKSKSLANFPASAVYSLGYYFVRRYCRGLNSRKYLGHFLGSLAPSVSQWMLFSTNTRSSITLGVLTALVYSFGGPIRVIERHWPGTGAAIDSFCQSLAMKFILLSLAVSLVLSQSEVDVAHFRDPKNGWIALQRCVITIWNFLKVDFQYVCTYSAAAWADYVTFFDSLSTIKVAQTAAEAMKLLVLYAGLTTSAKLIPYVPLLDTASTA